MGGAGASPVVLRLAAWLAGRLRGKVAVGLIVAVLGAIAAWAYERRRIAVAKAEAAVRAAKREREALGSPTSVAELQASVARVRAAERAFEAAWQRAREAEAARDAVREREHEARELPGRDEILRRAALLLDRREGATVR